MCRSGKTDKAPEGGVWAGGLEGVQKGVSRCKCNTDLVSLFIRQHPLRRVYILKEYCIFFTVNFYF